MRREAISFRRLPILGGVDLLRATFVNHAFSKHVHEEYAVGCIEQGALRFRYQGAGLVAPKGHVNLVVPGEAHDGQAASADGWTYRMFYIKPEAMLKVTAELCSRPSLPHFRQGVINDPDLARSLIDTHKILENTSAPLILKEARLLALLSSWIIRHGVEHADLPTLKSAPRAVAQAMEIIRARSSEDLSLKELADSAGVSPFHLIRAFSRSTKLTPHAFLIESRLHHIKAQLPTTDRLADIALAAGFADQSHMTRLFKRRFGVTPGQYRLAMSAGR